MDLFDRRGASTNGMPTSEQGMHSLRMKQLSSQQEGEMNGKKIFVRPTLPQQRRKRDTFTKETSRENAASSNETKELFSDGDGVESEDGEGGEEGSEEGEEEKMLCCTPVLPSASAKRANPFKVVCFQFV